MQYSLRLVQPAEPLQYHLPAALQYSLHAALEYNLPAAHSFNTEIRLNSKNLIRFIIATLQYLLPAALQHHLLARLQYLLQGCSTPCSSVVAPAMLQYCQHCRYRPFKTSDILFRVGGWVVGCTPGRWAHTQGERRAWWSRAWNVRERGGHTQLSPNRADP